MSLVTVYITNYNYGQYIRQAIESVLNQTLQDFELIIIDDGSTDDSESIIEEYRSNPKISIVYQKNKGLNVTNNIALRLSNGKYIMRLDADDYLEPNALEMLSSRLEADDELGLVFPDYYMVDNEGEIYEHQKRHNFDNEVSLYDQAAHGACTMIRAKFLKALGGYDESFKCQDGYELWVKFVRAYKVTNINEPLFHYRQHGNNLTSNENRILDTRAAINEKYINQDNVKHSSIAIIPVRGGKGDVAYRKMGEKTLLEIKIDEAIATKRFTKIIVTSSVDKVADIVKEYYSDESTVEFFHRTEEAARINTGLDVTIKQIIRNYSELEFDLIALLSIEYPFITTTKIKDALNTLVLFNSDSLISVRADNSLYFRHTGHGMEPIFDLANFTKLERESLYKHVGGITVVRRSVFEANGKVITGKVGHMVLDQKSAMGIFSEFDFQVGEMLMKQTVLV